MPMFWFVLLCGWGLTAAVIALVWIHTRPGRSLLTGLGIGIAGGLLWPVTVWMAVGAALYTRAGRASGSAPADGTDVAARVQQAHAFARQAEIEGMAASAEYWRAEIQRLTAQQSAAARTHPAATSMIVLGCTLAALATLGGLWLGTPSPEPAPTAAPAPLTPGGPVALVPPPPQAQAAPVLTEPVRTELGNIAKQYGEAASVVADNGSVIAEFTIGDPAVATCNPYSSEDPVNGRFIRLPVTLKTYDDPTDQLVFLSLGGGSWEYVSADGRSSEAATTAAAMCGYDVPSQLGPNRTYDFGVILDVSSAPGSLVLNASWSNNDAGGWEWAYSGS
jgi:hypothetical protein